MENALSFSSFSLKDPFSVSHTSVSSSTNSEQSKLGVVSFSFLFGPDLSIVDSGELAQQGYLKRGRLPKLVLIGR